MLEIASDPKHLGAEIGVIAILHTWGQNLLLHPHIHCVIPAGGLSLDQRRWVHPRYPFFLPVRVLSRVFRGKFLAGLKRLHRRKKLQCAGPAAALVDYKQFAKLLRRLHRHDCRSLTMANYLFGNYVLDVDERRLLRDNEEIRLRGKLFDTLRVLVENAGKLVRKDRFYGVRMAGLRR